MNSDNIILINLVLDYLREDISPEGQQQLNNILAASPGNQQLFNQLTDPDYIQQELIVMQQADVSAAWQKFKTGIPELEQNPKTAPVKKIKTKKIKIDKRNWWKWAAAAAVIVGLAIGARWWFNQPSTTPSATASITPAGNSATLTINDNTYTLTEDITDTLDDIPGMQVINQNASLWYQADNTAFINKEPKVNTVKTQQGRKYLVRLEDGTKVWVYPGTTISYAIPFAVNERIVQVTGEAYFEVTKEARPFRVYVQDSTGNERGIIDVIGTRFNVNAYPGSPIKTTLLEGRLQLSNSNSRPVELTPGQRATITGNTGISIGQTKQSITDTSSSRQGKFVFVEDDISFVINELARWYNLKAEVSEKLVAPLTMDFPRTTRIEEVLNILKKHANIRATITEGKIIAVPDE